MSDDERTPEPSVSGRPLPQCPGCGSDHLESVVEARVQDVNFLCRSCGRCWHVTLGRVSRVAPQTCFGCQERGRCELVYARDLPTQ
jgi:hypothetical protein